MGRCAWGTLLSRSSLTTSRLKIARSFADSTSIEQFCCERAWRSAMTLTTSKDLGWGIPHTDSLKLTDSSSLTVKVYDHDHLVGAIFKQSALYDPFSFRLNKPSQIQIIFALSLSLFQQVISVLLSIPKSSTRLSNPFSTSIPTFLRASCHLVILNKASKQWFQAFLSALFKSFLSQFKCAFFQVWPSFGG